MPFTVARNSWRQWFIAGIFVATPLTAQAQNDSESRLGDYIRQTLAPQWVPVTEMYLNAGALRQRIGPVFANSFTDQGLAPGFWQKVDLAKEPWSIPLDAKFALLS